MNIKLEYLGRTGLTFAKTYRVSWAHNLTGKYLNPDGDLFLTEVNRGFAGWCVVRGEKQKEAALIAAHRRAR